MKGKKFKIKKPLIVFDLETTGLSQQKDRIVEISIVKKFPGRKKDIIKTKRLNPGVKIPVESSNIHGITDEDVKNEPTFKMVSKSLAEFIKGCDVVGYNSDYFDVPFLLAEFERAGIEGAFDGAEFLDIYRLNKALNPRSLTAAYAEYCGKSLDAHKAEADALATFEVLEGMINEHHGEFEDESLTGLNSMYQEGKKLDLMGFVIESEAGPVFSKGKHKGELLINCRSYCDWVIKKSDFSKETKTVIKKILIS